jgi:LacI family transcriptional regulator
MKGYSPRAMARATHASGYSFGVDNKSLARKPSPVTPRAVTQPRATTPTRARITEVASLAGVSTATVSRVLNGQSVRPDAHSRVTHAVSRLGYVPHAGARALSLQRTGTVGAIFPTIDNAIFAKAIEAFQQRLSDEGLQLLIATSNYDPTREMQQAVNLVARGVDALALCGLGQTPALTQFLRQRGTPVVHVMSLPKPSRDPMKGGAALDDAPTCVGFDNAAPMATAVRYLVDLGHREIAMLAGLTTHNDRAQARVQGVRDALLEAGLTLPSRRLVERPYTLDAARDGLRDLMQPGHRAGARPTAVLCGNDVLATGALLEAQRLGLHVPRDVSILGFDDLEIAHHLSPSLTTLHVPTESMWKLAGDRLVAMLRGVAVPPTSTIEVNLVVRESTAPPRAPRATDTATPARRR